MKRYRVLFSPEARSDLNALYDWIVLNAGRQTANRYLDRLEDFILRLDTVPHRGTARTDIGEHVRSVSFRRRQRVVFRINDEASLVEVLGIYYRGADFVRGVRGPPEPGES